MNSIGILHLSDLHFKQGDKPEALLGPLREDLKKLPQTELAFVVVSGDFVDRGDVKAFPVVIEFLRDLQRETNVPWDRFILCPGNHDVQEVDGLFLFQEKLAPGDDDAKKLGEDGFLVRVTSKYGERFAALREAVKSLTGSDTDEHLSRAAFYREYGLQFVALNTAHRIDKHRRKDAAVDPVTFSELLGEADRQVAGVTEPILRIAVWHHAVQGKWCMADPDAAVERLASNDFALLLHGDVHETRAQIADPFQKKLYVAGCGKLRADDPDRPPGTSYNFLEIAGDFSWIRIHVREQTRRDGAFDGYPKFGEGKNKQDHFEIQAPRTRNGRQLPTAVLPPIKSRIAKLPSTDPTLYGRELELDTLENAWKTNANVVQIVASGGTGKTALMTNWYGRRLDEVPVVGWSFYKQGTGPNSNVSSDDFLQKAVEWFHLKPTGNTAESKVESLVEYLQRERTLLILDGLEPLQNQITGELNDYAMKDLLRELEVQNAGLVLCTTRERLVELTRATTVLLDNLSEADGARYLREKYGIYGSEEELRLASRAYGNHALALTLLGTWLQDRGGDVSKRFEIDQWVEDDKPGIHARRVMESYAKQFAGKPEGDLLRALGFFNRPAERTALKLVLQSRLQHRTLLRLQKARLIMVDGPEAAVDCHPLVREYFGARTKADDPEGFRAGHSKLFDHYCKLPSKEYPETLQEMEPLFHAVGHGCLAGRHWETCEKVYFIRILRGDEEFYLIKKLGAWGTNLALLAYFFERHWSQPHSSLAVDIQTWVLSLAANTLRNIGRLEDSVEALRTVAEARVQQELWGNAAASYNNLSELLLTLGRIEESITAARQSVKIADRNDDASSRTTSRSTLAEALHQSAGPARENALDEAKSLFAEAERIQAEWQPEHKILYSVRGYRYCDLLLGDSSANAEKVIRRATQTLAWVEPQSVLLNIGLDHLTLGRAYAAAGSIDESGYHLDQAVATLRRYGAQHFVARALLFRGDLQNRPGDLEEAYRIASRSGMRLILTDYHLATARRERSLEHLEKAEKLIQETGYHRRDTEAAALRRELIPAAE